MTLSSSGKSRNASSKGEASRLYRREIQWNKLLHGEWYISPLSSEIFRICWENSDNDDCLEYVSEMWLNHEINSSRLREMQSYQKNAGCLDYALQCIDKKLQDRLSFWELLLLFLTWQPGLRKVRPYYFTFTTFTKGRWAKCWHIKINFPMLKIWEFSATNSTHERGNENLNSFDSI